MPTVEVDLVLNEVGRMSRAFLLDSKSPVETAGSLTTVAGMSSAEGLAGPADCWGVPAADTWCLPLPSLVVSSPWHASMIELGADSDRAIARAVPQASAVIA